MICNIEFQFQFLNIKMVKFLKRFATLVVVPHFEALFCELNPVQENGRQVDLKVSRVNWHFLFCLLTFLFAAIDGNLGLHFEATHSLSLESLLISPYIINHQMFPK